ncbi:MAG TPA: hypothetical protein VFT29_20070 [Gemmatimonadaceae bacterium]|nr:hypothetical protein [Gemmatimonadaceae bacterium]
MRKTLKNLLVEYGFAAGVVYMVLFFVVWIGFWAAIRFGWKTDGVAANLGIWTAAYIATKVTQPLRIAATLALTPLLAKWYERVSAPLRSKRPASPSGERAPNEGATKADYGRSTTGSPASPQAGA